MKPYSKLLIAASLFVSQLAVGQTNSALTISSNYPEAGNKYELSYNSKGTPLDGIDSISMMFYYFVDADKSVSKTALTPIKTNGIWKSELMIPANAKAFYIS